MTKLSRRPSGVICVICVIFFHHRYTGWSFGGRGRACNIFPVYFWESVS